MQKMKVSNLNLNDGFLRCYRDKKLQSDFNAPKNPKKIDDMEASTSLKVGRAITCIPRKIKKALRK